MSGPFSIAMLNNQRVTTKKLDSVTNPKRRSFFVILASDHVKDLKLVVTLVMN